MSAADPQLVQQWWQAFQATGERQARDQLITHYLYLVKYAVGRMLVHLPSHLEADDLVGYGLIGLIQSVEKFELARGVRFETFAMTRIRGAILDQLRALDWMPRALRQKAREIEQAIQKLEQQHGKTADETAIAAELGIDLATLHTRLSETSFLVLSLDYLLTPQEASGETLGDLIASPQPTAEQQLDQAALQQILQAAIQSLPEREQQLIAFYYFEGLTLKEIGKVLGVSEARVCQLHAQSIHRLRVRMQTQL